MLSWIYLRFAAGGIDRPKTYTYTFAVSYTHLDVYKRQVYLLYDGKVRADGGLRLRSGPGESYEKLLTVPDGTVPVSYTHLDVYKRQG